MSRMNFPDRVSYDQIKCPYCWVETPEEHMTFIKGIGFVCNQCVKAKKLQPEKKEEVKPWKNSFSLSTARQT